MKKKELLDEIERHDYRLNSYHRSIVSLLNDKIRLEERIERLEKKLSKIAEYFHGTCHPHINQIEGLLNEKE